MAKKGTKRAAKRKTVIPTPVVVRRVRPSESPRKSNLVHNNPEGRGGVRDGAGRKPDQVKALERELLDAFYPQPGPNGSILIDRDGRPVMAEIGRMCVVRLIEIAHGDDVGAAERACRTLLDRKFGKAAEHKEVKLDAQVSAGLYIIPPPVISRLPSA